jgi:hypothetical protein
MKVSKIEIEKHRAFWTKIAKANGWYVEPFHVQVWIDKDGNVTDSVSHIDLTKDIVIEE